MKEIIAALDKAKGVKERPSIIIAETIKGKGISFMENKPLDFHGKAPTQAELDEALKELS
jgi:transketolase